ncbi:MAG TPA: OmpA family protein [Leptospiraceae bacterium]|nr:OmpA family protein [Leptospiraceae bacterium]HNE23945.1 OmpA family protein [Leptospiraceae bacterium]HNL01227.1 OmpA family protein [Leptospiraceae bacterium]
MMLRLLLALALFPGLAAAGPVRFEFKLEKDDVLAVDKYQDIRIQKNGEQKSREEKNRIVLKVSDSTPSGAVMEGLFHTYTRSPRLVGEYRRDRDFNSRFIFQKNGENVVSDDYVMPNLRGLPTFPDKELSAGDKWQAPGLETMDFGSTKIKIPLNVAYQFTGVTHLPEDSKLSQDAPEIQYVYTFHKAISDPRVPFKMIVGHSADRLWFDTNAGVPIFDTNRLTYTFYMRDGQILRMAYRIDSWWKKTRRARPEDRQEIVTDVNRQIAENPNVTVHQTDEGVVLNLNAILFDVDSANLSEQARGDLDRVAEILRKYPDREIRVSGHTDSTGGAAHNVKLSEDRARSVVQNLGKRTGIDSKRFSYRGYGSTKPAADNSTADGRAKNRRVEILIVTD